MKKLELKCIAFSHKSRKYKSYKGTIGKIAMNRINRRFKTSIPHQKITTDTSEFKIYTTDENFFGILKQEMYYGKIYKSFNELEIAIKEYIIYYNNKRIKEKLNWLSQVNYRIEYESKIA